MLPGIHEQIIFLDEENKFVKTQEFAAAVKASDNYFVIIMIDGKRVQDILRHPEDFIESRKYFSWERFFTALLVKYMQDSYLKYNKSKLNEAYLYEKVKRAITDVIEGVSWNEEQNN